MIMRRQALACVVSVLFAGVAIADEKPTPALMILSHLRIGSGAEAFGHCGMCVLSRGDIPVACFGLNKRPNEQTRYSYLLLFKAPAAKAKGGLTTEGSGSGSNLHLDLAAKMTFNGKVVAVTYQFTADKEKNILTSEVVKLGGEEVKRAAPRIYLVDLTLDKVTFVPVKVDRLDDVPDLTDRDQKSWAASVEKAIVQLRMKSPEVKKFLD
jgi:hypothetical protein